MKKLLLALLTFCFCYPLLSQNVFPVKTQDFLGSKSIEAISQKGFNETVTKKTKSSLGRWYNYGETMDELNNGTASLYGNILFPDSTILVNYGLSGYSGPWIHKLADLLDVTSEMFNDSVLHPGEQYIGENNFFSLDTIAIYCIYTRNIPDPSIVDTLLVEVSFNDNLMTAFFPPGPLPTNLGTDTVFIKRISYDYTTNSLDLPEKYVFKIPLTEATFADSMSNGFHEIIVPTPGLKTVNPGMLVVTSVGFIPGYSWIPNVDTLDKMNSLLFLSRKQHQSQFPFYLKHDYNISHIIPFDVRYNDAAGWNGLYVPSFAYMGGTQPTYSYQHHLFYYKASLSFNISFTTQNVSCYGGSDGAINLTTVVGGTAPYTYLWSHGETTQNVQNLSIGSYTVTISDAAGTDVVRVFEITEPQPMHATVTSTPASACGASDGSISVSSIQGGTPSYSVIVIDSDSVTQGMVGLSAGIYTVRITDAKGCRLEYFVAVNEIGAPTVNSTVSNISCNGFNDGSISLTVDNPTGSPIFTWNTGQSSSSIGSLSPGTYNVTITDDNCQMFETFDITQPDIIEIHETIVNPTPTSTSGSISLQVMGGTPPYTYLWSTGETTADIDNLTAGFYTVTVTDDNNCTQTKTIELILGTTFYDLSDKISIFPNPANDVVYIAFENINQGVVELNLYSIQGQKLKSLGKKSKNDVVGVDISSLAAGIYIIEIILDGQRVQKKIVK